MVFIPTIDKLKRCFSHSKSSSNPACTNISKQLPSRFVEDLPAEKTTISFIFDIWGVPTHFPQPLPDAKEVFEKFNAEKIPYLFMTTENDDSKDDKVREVQSKFGVSVCEDQVIVARNPLKDFVQKFKEKNVLVVGATVHEIWSLCRRYGVKNIYTPSDFSKPRSKLQISAILMWAPTQVRNTDLQLVADLLLGTCSLNPDSRLIGHPVLYWYEHSENSNVNGAQNMLKEALDKVWKDKTAGAQMLDSCFIRKPEPPYGSAERALHRSHFISYGGVDVPRITKTFFISDDRDLTGVRAHISRYCIKWTTILLGGGTSLNPKNEDSIAKCLRRVVEYALEDTGRAFLSPDVSSCLTLAPQISGLLKGQQSGQVIETTKIKLEANSNKPLPGLPGRTREPLPLLRHTSGFVSRITPAANLDTGLPEAHVRAPIRRNTMDQMSRPKLPPTPPPQTKLRTKIKRVMPGQELRNPTHARIAFAQPGTRLMSERSFERHMRRTVRVENIKLGETSKGKAPEIRLPTESRYSVQATQLEASDSSLDESDDESEHEGPEEKITVDAEPNGHPNIEQYLPEDDICVWPDLNRISLMPSPLRLRASRSTDLLRQYDFIHAQAKDMFDPNQGVDYWAEFRKQFPHGDEKDFIIFCNRGHLMILDDFVKNPDPMRRNDGSSKRAPVDRPVLAARTRSALTAKRVEAEVQHRIAE